MDNMWLTEDAFLDFDKKCIRFVNSDNKVVHEVPFPKGKKGEKAKLVILLEYLSRNRMRNRFEGEELIDVIWGKDNDGKDNTNLNRVLSDLRSLLRTSESFMIPIGSRWEEREYLFYPPLDKAPPNDLDSDESGLPDKQLPDDLDSEELRKPDELPLDDLDPKGVGQPEELPPDVLEPEEAEQLDMSLLRRAVDIGFGIRILLISMVGILLYRLTPLIYEYEIDKPGTIIHPLVALGIIITLILMIIVGVVGLLNDGNGQVIEAHVLKMTDYKKAPYHWIKSELRRLAGKTHVRRTAQRIIMLLVLVLLCGVILTHCADCTRDSFFRDYQTSETVMATSEVTTDLSSEWSEWIEWSSEPDIRSDDLEIETKTEEVQVPVNYHMYCYITRSLTDRSKEYRDYSIIKNYEQYGVSSAYGEIHIEETFTAECVESAEQIQPGQWTGWKTNEKLSYNRGNSTAYLIKSENFSGAFVAGDRSDYSSGMLLFFVADIDYETKSCIYYRYREKTNASEK